MNAFEIRYRTEILQNHFFIRRSRPSRKIEQIKETKTCVKRKKPEIDPLRSCRGHSARNAKVNSDIAPWINNIEFFATLASELATKSGFNCGRGF